MSGAGGIPTAIPDPCRVLVLDGDMVPALAIARSLYARGVCVDVASHVPKPLVAYSRSVERVCDCPNPLTQTELFIEWLQQHCQAQHYDLVIPVTERSLVPISNLREKLAPIPIAMPSADALDIVLDKSRTMAMAAELGVPVPGSVLIGSMDELEAAIGDIRFPVVLKPSRSIGSGDSGASQLQVSYAFDEGELRAGCLHALRFGQVLLQEYFQGAGVGIELIAQQGELVYAFQHRRLHEVPLTGGGSSLRKSQAVSPLLLEASRKLIESLQWNGVAMVEFKLNEESGEFCLMEINGRFWGSLPLAEAAGADFPSMLLDLELTGSVIPCVPYREEIHCRLLSRDLGWYEAVLRKDADPRLANFPTRVELLKDLALFLSFKHRMDVLKLSDPLPGLIDILRIFQTHARRAAVLFQEKRFLAAQKKAWRSGKVGALVKNSKSLLFLCYGNINRSALADELVRAYAEDSGITVQSAGFHEIAGRPADPVMVDVAAQEGCDLASARSETVREGDIERADVIFVMEQRHYDAVVKLHADAASKTFLLGAHAGHDGWSPEIADPYGGSRSAYDTCYRRIAAASDHLKAFMAARGPE